LAGLQVPTCRSDPILGAKVNVIGTLNVFEAVRKYAKNEVKGIAYASSAAVVGPTSDYSSNQFPLSDTERHFPRTHYGVFKSANEGNALVYLHDHNISSLGIRPFTVYGVGRELGVTSGPTKAAKYCILRQLGALNKNNNTIKDPNFKFLVPFVGVTSFNYVKDVARIFIEAVRKCEHQKNEKKKRKSDRNKRGCLECIGIFAKI